MQPKTSTTLLFALSLLISDCGISIQASNTETPAPVIITVTLPPTQTARPSETPVPSTPSPLAISVEGRTSTQVNIRSGPGTNFDSIGILNANDTVTLTGKNRESSWLQIEYAAGSDGKGWVSAGYIKADGMDALPIVSELGDLIGTATPLDTPLPSPPTLVPASPDFDSAETPLRSVTLEPTGTTSLLFSDDISAPTGDTDDWLAITPFTNTLLVDMQCVGSATLQLDISGVDQPVACNSGQQVVHVSADKPLLFHVQADLNSNELQHTRYTISIVSVP